MPATVSGGSLGRWFEQLCRIRHQRLRPIVTDSNEGLRPNQLPRHGGVYAFWWTGNQDLLGQRNRDLVLYGPGELIRGIDERKDAVFEKLIGELRETHGGSDLRPPDERGLPPRPTARHRGHPQGRRQGGGNRPLARPVRACRARPRMAGGIRLLCNPLRKFASPDQEAGGQKRHGFPSRALHDKFREIAWQAVPCPA